MLFSAIERYGDGGSLSEPITDSASLRRALSGGILTRSGERVDEQSALNVSAFYAAKSLICGSISSLPVHVIRTEGNRRSPADDLGISEVFSKRPNGYLDPMQWREGILSDLVLRGNSYQFIQKSGAEPRGFLPIDPDRVEVLLTKSGRKRFRISASDFSEGATPTDDLTGDTLTDEKVLHIMGHTLDGVEGVSLLSHARESLGLITSADIAWSRLFREGLMNRGFFVTEDAMDDEGVTDFQSVMAAQSGAWRAGGAPLLPFGVKFEGMAMSASDAEIVMSKEIGVRDIARFFNLPPDVLGDIAAQPRANMEQNSRRIFQFALLTWVTRLERAIQFQIFSKFSAYASQDLSLKHSFENFLRGDLLTRVRAYTMMLTWGLLTRNEIRALEDLNPIDGPAGESILQPMNHQVVGPGDLPQSSEESPSEPGGGVPVAGPPDGPKLVDASEIYRETIASLERLRAG